MFDYLNLTIKKLEERNAAETIEKVISFDVKEGGRFKIFIENSISNPVSYDCDSIEKLDKLRENSLFSISIVPQKTLHSVISPNVISLFIIY